ncbi:MAG: SbcC/MukB-like Walker B domain-containing protein, partial [Acidimicrobiia bacterium]
LEALAEQGIATQRPDDAALRAAADVARAEADDMTIRHTTLRIALDEARGELREHDRLVSESGDVHQQHLLARRAHKVCSEGGVVNMPLRRWVLAIELDRVANAANVHLQRMTSGRYTVRRRQEVRDGRKAFGLDLEVLDAHTGRTRATSSLSGGEQFQASLALALGLADVVSHGGTASGKRFEALFVDEGFGSLDPSALQDAIAALHQLRATGRMVGVITHVEDLKRDLHVGIEVKRLADGKGSTLIVRR